MIGKDLFRHRMKKERKFQWSNLTSIVDHTILLYGLLFLGLMVAITYDSIPVIFAAMREIPIWLLFFAIYQLCWFGTIRIYMEFADEFFLISRKDVQLSIKLYSLSWYFAKFLLQTMIITIVLYFVLINVLESTFPIIMFLLFVSLYRLFILTLRKVVSIFLVGWKRYVMIISFYIIFLFFGYLIIGQQLYLISYIFLTIMVLINGAILIKSNSFVDDTIENEKQRMRYISLIFHASEYVHIPAATSRTKPVFFRKSQRIFTKRSKQNVLTEVYIKYFLRNYRYPISYLQIISITIVAVALLPNWMKYAILIGFYYFMKEWLRALYDEIVTHPYMQMYKSRITDVNSDKVIRLFSIPATTMVGIIVVIATIINI